MADPIIGKISVGDGATFTPAVDNDGVISWSNNKNLPNPASVDIPQAVMNRYLIAPIASPAFTGNPTAPTQAKTDNSTKLATTAYVKAVVADYLELTGGSITGDVDITGDLSVSGTITGDLIGNVTGNLTGNATNDENGNNIAKTYLPAVVGAVVAFAGSTSPAGWLLCDGSAVSRTTYAALFAVIGTTYGSGDGSTTFNVPNLTDKFIQGNSTSGTVKSVGLPNITGAFRVRVANGGYFSGITQQSGAFYTNGQYDATSVTATYGTQTGFKSDFMFDASKSNSVYGNSTTVQPPALTMRYIIKY